MISSEIEHTLIKFLNKSANGEELDRLSVWIENPSNEAVFRAYVKLNHAVTLSMNNPDSDDIRKLLLKEIRKEKKKLRVAWMKSIAKYAAVALVFMGLGYYAQNINFGAQENTPIAVNEEVITLELADGNIQVISEDGSTKVVDKDGNVVGAQNGDKLVYNADAEVETLTYNKLTIPYGKRFDILLSDGTTVFLNAGSSIRYPVKFIKGMDRQVFLDGEAFFDVAKDANHPFIVDAQEINVEVLGTKFNVSSYQDDAKIDVVLVEGSVSLDKVAANPTEEKEEGIVLKPGFNGSFDKSQKTISTEKVNTSLFTSWMTGTMVFRNTLFKEIIKKLERVYNIPIILKNKELANEHFNATIEVDKETIEEVLDYFQIYDIEYTVLEDKIIIN